MSEPKFPKTLCLRMTPKMWEGLKIAAEAKGMYVTQIIRQAVSVVLMSHIKEINKDNVDIDISK